MKSFKRYSSVFLITAITSFISTTCFTQMTKQDSLWLPLRVFIGSWQGTGHGEPGTGEYLRTYQFVLNKKFIETRNKSTYGPTAENPNGEVHEDWGYFSYDKMRRTFILRQFHIEGFVNQYKLDSISENGKNLVFVSEAIENIPPGWRARESYEILDSDRIQETFELAEPDKPFSVYSKVLLRRVK